jgi:hypothetical protein
MSTPAAVQSQKQWEVESGRKVGAMIAFVYGVEGIGKSSFAKDAGARLIDVEHGTGELVVDRFKEPEEGWTWSSVLELLRWLATGQHKHTAVAIDTLDALESLIWRHICARDEKKNIEDYGYGKGYVAALDEWKILVTAIEMLKLRRGINVFLLAHSQVKTFKNPEGEDFDRYSPAIHEKAAGLLKGRSDVVLFANHETFAKKKDERNKIEKAKGFGTGRRLIYTTRTAAYDAKNRYDLPPAMLLDYAAFIAACGQCRRHAGRPPQADRGEGRADEGERRRRRGGRGGHRRRDQARRRGRPEAPPAQQLGSGQARGAGRGRAVNRSTSKEETRT